MAPPGSPWLPLAPRWLLLAPPGPSWPLLGPYLVEGLLITVVILCKYLQTIYIWLYLAINHYKVVISDLTAL